MFAVVGSLRRHPDDLVLLAVTLLATVPVWMPTYPPMVDLPQHASQVALLKSLQDPSFEFAGLYEVNWFTPYLMGYMSVYALSWPLGIVGACKLVVCVALAGIPLATALLMTETGTDRRWAVLTVPAMYGFAYQWGLLNFLVAAPLGIVFLWLAMRHARNPTLNTSVWMAVAANVLFFCHALVCLLFAVIAACHILIAAGNLRAALKRVAPLAAVVPVMTVWGARIASHPVARGPVVWDFGLERLTGMVPRILGVPPGSVFLALGLTIICLPLLADARLNSRRATWIPFLVCAGALMLVPHGIFGFTFAYHRLTLFAVPLYLIAFTESSATARHRWIRPALPLAALSWILVVGGYTLKYEAEVKGFDEVIDRMVPGQRALSLVFWQDSRGSSAPTFQHFTSWYAARKRGLVDPSFAALSIVLVHYREEDLSRASRMFMLSVNPAPFNWRTFHGDDYRSFVVRGFSDLGPELFSGAPCPVRLAYHSNGWWLYEKEARCGSPLGAGRRERASAMAAVGCPLAGAATGCLTRHGPRAPSAAPGGPGPIPGG